MAYHIEKDTGDIVIDGWQNGIADSPYNGIADMRNINPHYLPGGAYVNYKRQQTSSAQATGTISVTVDVSTLIAFDSSSSTQGVTSGSFTWPHTVSGTNTILFVNAVTFTNTNVITSVTYNGVAMTQLTVGTGNAAAGLITLWYLFAPTTGTNTISVSFSGGSVNYQGFAESFNGASQTIPPAAGLHSASSATSLTSSITTGGDKYWLIGAFANSNTTTANLALTTGTLRQSLTNFGIQTQYGGIGDSGMAESPIGTYSLVSTLSPAGNLFSILAYFAPFHIATFNGNLNTTLVAKVGDVVQFTTTGSLPTPLVAPTAGNTAYYQILTITPGSSMTVVTLNPNTATGVPSGSVVVITSNGSGVNTVTTVLMGIPIQCTDYFLLGGAYTNPVGGVTWFIIDNLGLLWQNAGLQSNIHVFNVVAYIINSNQAPSSLVGVMNYGNFIFTINSDGQMYSYYPQSNTLAPLGSPITANVPHIMVSGTDAIGYICNGNQIAAISNPSLNWGTIGDYSLNAGALVLPINEVSVWLDQLQSNLLISGINKIYPWDRVSTGTGVPLPMNEVINKTINIQNNVYIFAGNKGNIYTTNGYVIDFFKKLPDSIVGVIDPTWLWGGVMGKRGKLYFGASSPFPTGGTTIGIFSIDINESSPSITTAGVLTYENQNSYGSTVSSNLDNVYCLMPDDNYVNYTTNTSLVQTNDFYYSAWYTPATSGGIDYNTTIPYFSNEAYIITDLIPIGTLYKKQTYAQLEYKLDWPLQFNNGSGESVSLAYRETLDQSFTAVLLPNSTATSGSRIFSDVTTTVNFQELQWVQFKIVLNSTNNSTGNSFVRFKELRIHPS